jgi:hypothetical protein
MVDAKPCQTNANINVGRGRRRDDGNVKRALRKRRVKVGIRRDVENTVSLRDLGPTSGVRLTKRDAFASSKITENAQVSFSDGARSDDKHFHGSGAQKENGQSPRKRKIDSQHGWTCRNFETCMYPLFLSCFYLIFFFLVCLLLFILSLSL